MTHELSGTLDELQRAVLRGLAEGMTGPQVARSVAISEATMRRALRRARRILGASTTINAVYVATKKGLI